MQGGDPTLCAEFGLRCTTFGTLPAVGGLADLARLWVDLGFECSTLHLGTGMESDDDANRLIEEVLDVSERTGLPLYIETHRATLTQDIWRTVALVERYPELRFNGDFSHWYTGLEMTYGDFEAKLAFLRPVFERTTFMHGRIGDSGCIQIPLTAPGTGEPLAGAAVPVEHFRRFWTEAGTRVPQPRRSRRRAGLRAGVAPVVDQLRGDGPGGRRRRARRGERPLGSTRRI